MEISKAVESTQGLIEISGIGHIGRNLKDGRNILSPGTCEEYQDIVDVALASDGSIPTRVDVLSDLYQLIRNYQGQDVDLKVTLQLKVRGKEAAEKRQPQT